VSVTVKQDQNEHYMQSLRQCLSDKYTSCPAAAATRTDVTDVTKQHTAASNSLQLASDAVQVLPPGVTSRNGAFW
jgi:hypothetical protein